jgi:hypothetical protein
MYWRTRRHKLPTAHIITAQKEAIPAPQPYEHIGTAPELPRKPSVTIQKAAPMKEPEFAILREIKEREARSKAAKEAWKAKHPPAKPTHPVKKKKKR